jgi:hypothetical protein
MGIFTEDAGGHGVADVQMRPRRHQLLHHFLMLPWIQGQRGWIQGQRGEIQG